jgi:hypothetical protein
MTMSDRRADRRRIDRRAFRPTLDGRLESRKLLAHFGRWGYIYPANHIQTAQNGQAVDITTTTGQSFFIQVSGGGTVQAYAMTGGRYGLRLLGTNSQTVVTINPVVDSIIKQTAHTFNTRQSQYSGMINIGSISVATGMINDILGYKTAILSGPLVATGTNPIDRIAFDALAPGTNIITGGDVNTLDIATTVNLSGRNTGINVGRNLNFFSTFGDINVSNGANFIVGSDIGLFGQPAKGTGPSSIPGNASFLSSTSTVTTFPGYQAFAIQGNVNIASGSTMTFGGTIDAELFVSGTFTGLTNLHTQGLRVVTQNNNVGSLALLGNGIFISTSGLPNGVYPLNF